MRCHCFAGSVLGYFAARVFVGPLVLGLFADAQSVLHFFELGVVMFLFVIRLELRPQERWAMRDQIFGSGPCAGRRRNGSWATKLLPGGLKRYPNVQAHHNRIDADPAVQKVLASEAGR